jgi:hypothetical protein
MTAVNKHVSFLQLQALLFCVRMRKHFFSSSPYRGTPPGSKKEMRTYILGILVILEETKSSGYLTLAKLKAATQISGVDDIENIWKMSSIPAIDRLEKLDFYRDHLTMLDLWRNRRQDE